MVESKIRTFQRRVAPCGKADVSAGVSSVQLAALISLYGLVIWRGIRASLNATEPFGTYLGLGITTLIGFQAVVNMSVAMGLVPTKGLTLPFISYGGSSLIVLMGAAGLLLSISGAADGGKNRVKAVKVTKADLPMGGAEATA